MATLNLNENDLRELLTILNGSLYDASQRLRQIAPEDQAGEQAHHDLIAKWIHRLSDLPHSRSQDRQE